MLPSFKETANSNEFQKNIHPVYTYFSIKKLFYRFKSSKNRLEELFIGKYFAETIESQNILKSLKKITYSVEMPNSNTYKKFNPIKIGYCDY